MNLFFTLNMNEFILSCRYFKATDLISQLGLCDYAEHAIYN